MRLLRRILVTVLLATVSIVLIMTIKSGGDDYFESYYLLGLFKSRKPVYSEKLPLSPTEQKVFDAPLFESSEALTTASTPARYFHVDGFHFCKMLNNASFDSLAVVASWGRFVDYIDGKALRLANRLKKYGEVDRFSCFTVAEGANPFANVTSDRLLHRMDPFAYLMMVHGNKTNIENLYGAIEEFIKTRDIAMNAKVRPTQPAVPGNVYLAQHRYDGLWGHASLVNMEVSGYWELLDMADWDFVINISGMDYPLRHSREIYRGREFINWWEDTSQEAFRMLRPYLARSNRILKGTKLVSEMTSYHPLETGLFFPPFSGWKLCQQIQWMTLSRNFVKYLRHSREALHMLAFIQHTFVPDQSFFCYVAINTPILPNAPFPKRNIFLQRYNDNNHAALLDVSTVRNIGPRYFFARKVDLRTSKGRDHLKKHLQVGGYGELLGLRMLIIRGREKKTLNAGW
ncbi:hypothetical protein BC829DRAFT_388619, partial [Chytridium lagenaria]